LARNPRAAELSAGRAVSQVHDARTERARLDQFHVDTVISREERDAAADRDRRDEQPVLVDRSRRAASAASSAPPTATSRRTDSWNEVSSARRSSLASVVFAPSTESSVRENTTFGSACQISTNSRTMSEGFLSAVGLPVRPDDIAVGRDVAHLVDHFRHPHSSSSMGTGNRYDPAKPRNSSEQPCPSDQRHPPADSAAPDLGRRLDSPGPVTRRASHLAA
jgi:hypothetical protein